MTEQKSVCICCGGEATRICLPGLIECAACGHVCTNLRFSPEELARLYSRNYFQGGEYWDYRNEAPALRHNFVPRVRELAQRFPKGARLWEIGVAYGYFLREAGAHFDAAGCDISADALRYAREVFGLNVECVDFLSRPPAEPFDVVCMWDTIEHLQEPHRYVEKAVAELRSGGVLALSTGDIGSAHARRRGARWRLIHPPSHLHYFTSGSMRCLLTSVGLTDIRIAYLPFWRTARSAAYHLLSAGRRGPGATAYTVLDRLGLLSWSFPLNLRDIMVVRAVKP